MQIGLDAYMTKGLPVALLSLLVGTERERCPWAISIIVLVIRCPTHIVLVHMY
jgi:hypothetical protein